MCLFLLESRMGYRRVEWGADTQFSTAGLNGVLTLNSANTWAAPHPLPVAKLAAAHLCLFQHRYRNRKQGMSVCGGNSPKMGCA